MQIRDNRSQEWLVRPPYGTIVEVSGAREAGAVSCTLEEGYSLVIGYEEIEQLFKAMDGYTGKIKWGEK